MDLIGALLARLDGFNRRHPWSHNDYYGAWVARQVRSGGHVLDVGCGTGNLIARLRGNAATVTGLEPDPATASIAAQRFADDPAITIKQTGFSGRDPHQGCGLSPGLSTR
jgi:2-polyprenyl-3-methyl-5-hydroxy-6-metoxy-1,4-benzoquinol methylase